jgi:N-acyl-D-aspartate/D-glutamate deacylase
MTQLVVKGGLVVDGTGAAGVHADVAIDAGRVSAVGPDLDGDLVLDARDHVVAPGFIDIHTHYDAQVFWDPALSPSCFQGVTTVVAGNCGFSIAPTRPEHRDLIARTLENVEDMDVAALAEGVPWDTFTTFPEYLASVEAHGLGLNFAAYIGHTALRIFVMGEEACQRAADPGEIVDMQRILRDALEAGAAGFATSFAPTHRGAEGRPVPSRLAERAELDALLRTLGDFGRGVGAFAPGGLLGVADLYDIQRSVGVPFTYGALLTMPTGSHVRLLAVNEAGWDAGAEVWPQVTPRPLKFSMSMAEPLILNVNPRFGELMSVDVETRRSAYADPEFRTNANRDWDGTAFGIPRWETYEIAESTTNPQLDGRRLTDLAAERGTTPFDTLMDLAVAEPTIRMACILANDDAAEVAKVLIGRHVTLGLSDAGAHVSQLCDAPQATDYLGNWVRDRQLMPLEEAIRRLTSQQADIFGMVDRGRLVPGAWADVVVFDPATVAPGPLRRLRDFPAGSERLTADQPIGVRHVLVNGVPIRLDGINDAAARPGHIVKPGART